MRLHSGELIEIYRCSTWDKQAETEIMDDTIVESFMF